MSKTKVGQRGRDGSGLQPRTDPPGRSERGLDAGTAAATEAEEGPRGAGARSSTAQML